MSGSQLKPPALPGDTYLFTKLYDELFHHRGQHPFLRFRNSNTAAQLTKSIQELFDEAKDHWPGVFLADERIRLSPDHLQVCIGSLEEWKLFNSNLDVIDDAFEYLVNKSSKGEKGQYFTPRWVIDMCVRMLDPKEHETIIDTACGSAGFTVHAMFHVWRKIIADMGLQESHLFTMDTKPVRCVDYVRDKMFAIDFDEKSVRVSRCLNLIAGDGETNVLAPEHAWTGPNGMKPCARTTGPTPMAMDGVDYANTEPEIRQALTTASSSFDIVMANPPFAGDIKQSDMLALPMNLLT